MIELMLHSFCVAGITHGGGMDLMGVQLLGLLSIITWGFVASAMILVVIRCQNML